MINILLKSKRSWLAHRTSTNVFGVERVKKANTQVY